MQDFLEGSTAALNNFKVLDVTSSAVKECADAIQNSENAIQFESAKIATFFNECFLRTRNSLR